MNQTSPAFKPMPKTALITGAARRIGRALAEALAADGWAVAIHSAHGADETLAALKAHGVKAASIEADLSRHADVATLVPAAVKQLGPIGCLINNASIFERDDIESATLESWDSHIAINLRAPFFLTQAFAKQLPEDHHGVVINMVDERVWHLTPHFASYTVSKAGLWTLTQTLAMALAPRIRVNAIGPGPTLPSPRQTQAQFDDMQAKMPLGRGTTPAEICAAARFILAAPALTGQMIALDGGQHLGWGQVSKNDEPED